MRDAKGDVDGEVAVADETTGTDRGSRREGGPLVRFRRRLGSAADGGRRQGGSDGKRNCPRALLNLACQGQR